MKPFLLGFIVLPVAVALPAIAGLSSAYGQELSIGVYGDVTAEIGRTVAADGAATKDSSFAIPNLDLFLRGSNDKWSFLAEALFDIDDGNEIVVDVDRLVVAYQHAEWLRISAGRFHAAWGYYNTAYPHGGAIYLLAVDRPLLLEQHDARTLLPTSTVGVNFHGRLPIGTGTQAFGYDLDVANGRTEASDPIASGHDLNFAKAYNVRLRYEIRGLIVGINAAVDWIPPRLTPPEQPETLREQTFGGHLAYVEDPWHLIAEIYRISHVGAETHSTTAGLAEAGYMIGPLTPYVRFEFAKFPSSLDPFWAATAQQSRGDFQALNLGTKWLVNESIALKLELTWNHADLDTRYQATTQLAFGF